MSSEKQAPVWQRLLHDLLLGGGSVSVLVFLIFKDFGKLVGIAFVLAVPLAYMGMERWLTEFAYRTDVGFSTFALAGGLSVLIALLTVSYHSIK